MSAEDDAHALRYVREAVTTWPASLIRPAPLEALVSRRHMHLLAWCNGVVLPEGVEVRDWQWREALEHVERLACVRIGDREVSLEALQGVFERSQEVRDALGDKFRPGA